MVMKPKGVMCYICGREYGTTSIEIHLKACVKKWDIEQEKLPKAQRRPCPTKPVSFDDMVIGAKKTGSAAGASAEMEAYNDAAFEEYNTKALVPCNLCNRTFLPDSLVRHAKTCKGTNPRKVGGGSPTREELKKM
jgi:hypothetical protein